MVLADASAQVPWAQYGLAGLMFAVLLLGVQRIYRDLNKRLSDAEDEVRRLNEVIRDKYVPALEETRAALIEAQELIVTLRAELRNR